jgi:type 1 fimbria pilin
MNRSVKATFAMACLALSVCLYPRPSMGVDLTIHFTGRFIEPTCEMTLQDIDLGEASVSDFTGSFDTPWVDVPVTFAGCAALVTRATLSFSGTADADRSEVYAGKPGVGVELRSQPGGVLLGPGSASIDAPISNGGAVVRYVARMTQTAAGVTPGVLSTPVTVSVTYQ